MNNGLDNESIDWNHEENGIPEALGLTISQVKGAEETLERIAEDVEVKTKIYHEILTRDDLSDGQKVYLLTSYQIMANPPLSSAPPGALATRLGGILTEIKKHDRGEAVAYMKTIISSILAVAFEKETSIEILEDVKSRAVSGELGALANFAEEVVEKRERLDKFKSKRRGDDGK